MTYLTLFYVSVKYHSAWGIFSKTRRASAAENKDCSTCFAAYSASLADQLQSDDLEGNERVSLQSEKASFKKMSDKEKQRWLDYKKRGGFEVKVGAARAFPDGKCC